MYKIFHENKALIFPKIEGNSLKLDATLQESDRYDAELLCDFLPEWLDDRDPGDTFIHEVGENAVASALKETFKMAPAAGGVVITNGKIVSITRHVVSLLLAAFGRSRRVRPPSTGSVYSGKLPGERIGYRCRVKLVILTLWSATLVLTQGPAGYEPVALPLS